MLKLNNSPSLDPLHSPLSAQDAGPPLPQNQATPDPMAKTKRRMFSTPLLRRSATASSAAAASAASMIKSNLSTVTKLPTALKRASANSGSAVDDHKATVGRAPTIPSLSRSSTDSSVKQEEAKATPQQNGNRMFGIPSLMHIRTSSKDKTHPKPLPVSTASDCPLDSPELSDHSSRGNNSENEAENEQKSAANTASRFVMGVPAMLRRAVSNNHTPPTAAAPQKKSPDTSPNSTPRGEFSEDDLENDRHSLLLMLQVPEERRSQIPLMAASEAW